MLMMHSAYVVSKINEGILSGLHKSIVICALAVEPHVKFESY